MEFEIESFQMGFCLSLISHDIFEIEIKCEFLVPHEIKNNTKFKVKTEKKKKKYNTPGPGGDLHAFFVYS